MKTQQTDEMSIGIRFKLEKSPDVLGTKCPPCLPFIRSVIPAPCLQIEFN